MRLLLAGCAALLLSASLAGCFERDGTLAIQLEVSREGAIREFRTANLTLQKVRIDARTLDPEDFPSAVTRLDLVRAAAEVPQDLFRQTVRADQYTKIELIPPQGSTHEGVLLDGTRVAIVVGNAVIITTDFEVPRGGEKTFVFVVKIAKQDSGVGLPRYQVVPEPEASRVL